MTVSDIKIEDIESLAKAILYANERFKGQVWWRGQRCSNWKLLPSVFRREGGYEYEQNVILRFQQRAPSRYQNIPRLDDWFSWLFLMQQYRLPTRLLDWTESPLVACYFSIEEQKNKLEDQGYKAQDGTLFALSPYLLNRAQVAENGLMMPEDDRSIRAIRKAFVSDAQDADYVIAVLPSEVDIRMMVQLSVFTIHASGSSIDELAERDDFLLKFEIPAASKGHLKEHLKYLGIRESNLFPDLEHLAKETSALSFNPPEDKPRPPDEGDQLTTRSWQRPTTAST